jgi:hypothetical protein
LIWRKNQSVEVDVIGFPFLDTATKILDPVIVPETMDKSRTTTIKRSAWVSYTTFGSVKRRGVNPENIVAKGVGPNTAVPSFRMHSICVFVTAISETVPAAPCGSAGIVPPPVLSP